MYSFLRFRFSPLCSHADEPPCFKRHTRQSVTSLIYIWTGYKVMNSCDQSIKGDNSTGSYLWSTRLNWRTDGWRIYAAQLSVSLNLKHSRWFIAPWFHMRGLGFDLDRFPCVGFRRWVWQSGMDIIFMENTPQSIFHELHSSPPDGCCSELLVKQWHQDSVLPLSLSSSQTNQPTNRWWLSPASSPTASAHILITLASDED